MRTSLPDADEPGRKHAQNVARSCHAAGLKVKIVNLQNLPAKGDISDWLGDGHTREELAAIVRVTPLYTPAVAPATKPASNGLAFTNLGDFLAEPDEQRQYITEGCLATGSVNLMSAKPKVGKSTAARHLALEVARGGSWLGRACQQGVVWYLAFEGRRADIKQHFRQMGGTLADPIRIFTGQAPAAVVRQLKEIAIHERPLLIIIDTMQRLIRAKSTDDYAEMSNLLDDVIAVASESDAAVLMLHHNSKVDRAGIDAVLGSTAISGSMDTIFLLGRTDS